MISDQGMSSRRIGIFKPGIPANCDCFEKGPFNKYVKIINSNEELKSILKMGNNQQKIDIYIYIEVLFKLLTEAKDQTEGKIDFHELTGKCGSMACFYIVGDRQNVINLREKRKELTGLKIGGLINYDELSLKIPTSCLDITLENISKHRNSDEHHLVELFWNDFTDFNAIITDKREEMNDILETEANNHSNKLSVQCN